MEPTRLERQTHRTLAENFVELPKDCDVGTQKNSKGHKETWGCLPAPSRQDEWRNSGGRDPDLAFIARPLQLSSQRVS